MAEDSEIVQVIHNFYHNAEYRQKAHSQLAKLQMSPDAWRFCWRLLSLDKSQEVQFFGATTLLTKILKHWHEVPEELIPNLHTQLLEKLKEFILHSSNKLIVNKLCAAFSSFVLQTVYTTWPDAIQHTVTHTFHQIDTLNDEMRCYLILEILAGLPDQYPHANFNTEKGQKAGVHSKLSNSFPFVKDFLNSLLNAGVNVPTSIQDKALRCLGSWIEFGVRLDEVTGLLDKAFQTIHDEQLFEASIDLLIFAFTKNEPVKYPSIVTKYVPEVLKLSDLWQTALHNEDMESARDLSRLIINFAEENVNLILSYVTADEDRQQYAMRLVNLLVMLTDVKGCFPVDESISDLPFGFWYILQDTILALDDKKNLYVELFTPVYISLVQVLMRKVQYPADDVFSSMSAEEKEQFRCYRQDISDTVMYANCLLRENLIEQLKVYLRSVTQALPNVRWQDVESLLYVLSNVTEDCMTFEEGDDLDDDYTGNGASQSQTGVFDEVMVDLINLLTKLDLSNIILLNTALQALDAFAEHYSAVPNVLNVVFPVILLHGLTHTETVLYATRALKDICKENQEFLAPYAEGILNVCHNKLLDGDLAPKNAARLLSCVGHVLSSLSFNEIILWLNKLLPPITESLNQAIQSPPSMTTKVLIMDKLQMLTWLFDSLDVKRDRNSGTQQIQPVFVIIKELLPVIQTLLAHWVKDSEIVQCVTELLKRSLGTLLDDFQDILPTVCGLLMEMFTCQQHASILDLIKQLVLMFGRDLNTADIVKKTFHSVSCKAVEVIRQDPRSQTELLETYMNLCVQISKKLPPLMADPQYPLHDSVNIAVYGVALPEAPTMKASCNYLTDIFSKKDVYPGLEPLVTQIAPHLYDVMLRSIGGASPRANIENTVPLFIALNVNYFEIIQPVTTSLMSQENYPAPAPTPVQKERFLKDLLKERSNKRKLKDVIANFSMVCRGIAGTEYAQATTPSPFF